MPRYTAKRDGNESAIVSALEQIGATVARIDATNFPDLVVGFRGQNFLLEVKDKNGRGRVSDGQREFIETWRGYPVAVVWTVDDALEAIGAV